MTDERLHTLEQLRRELTARLETIKLQELNRISNEPGSIERAPADFPVVFIAPLVQNHLILPWERPPRLVNSSHEFAQYQKEGEAREFVGSDFSGANDAYAQALAAAHSRQDRCFAMLARGRVLIKAGRKDEAAGVYRSMLAECDSLEDADGMDTALYAAERLASLDLDVSAAQEYVITRTRSFRWLPPVQAYLMRTLLRDAATPDAAQARDRLSREIHDVEQIMALANDLNRLGRLDFPFHASPGKSVWLAYGDEPWLVTVMSTAAFTPPVVLAV